jgi:polygalacturonase
MRHAIFMPGTLALIAATWLGTTGCVATRNFSSSIIQTETGTYSVRNFGARGDGKTLDTQAINSAIAAANAAGGGTVCFPAGTYRATSIHLKSNVTLYLEHGAIIKAASETVAAYDEAEPTVSTQYQDFGHSHWHDSLIWGENLENISILGPGLIWGEGLQKNDQDTAKGVGNKAISLVNCHNVLLRDFSILHGGWFGILATGVNNLTIDNLKIDTNRDGMDVDCCDNVRIVNCSVNSPWDDGICLKSSYALGHVRSTENVTINNCFVTGGLIEGTLLDGTFKRAPAGYASRTGRIKFGTESNGGFKNITVSNCIFEDCGGLAIESVDGAIIEDVTIDNLAMRDIGNSPIFIRLGNRARGPDHPPVGVIRRINISDVVVSGASAKLGSIISGLPGHPVEDVSIRNMQVVQAGGGTVEQAAVEPPEKESDYPEPSMFGTMPSYGFFVRHARGVEFNHIKISTLAEDHRPAFMLDDVDGADFIDLKCPQVTDVPAFNLKFVQNFNLHLSPPLPDTTLKQGAKHIFSE